MTQKAQPKAKAEAVKVAETPKAAPILTTKEVAALVGTTPKALRRVLRAKWYADGKHTNYAWSEGDAILKEIVDHYAAKQVEATKVAVEGQA